MLVAGLELGGNPSGNPSFLAGLSDSKPRESRLRVDWGQTDERASSSPLAGP